MKTKRKGPGRPPKAKSERKDVDLRIPVTSEQKALVLLAAQRSGLDMAAWARTILIREAERQSDNQG